jgi:hypothetical protein
MGKVVLPLKVIGPNIISIMGLVPLTPTLVLPTREPQCACGDVPVLLGVMDANGADAKRCVASMHRRLEKSNTTVCLRGHPWEACHC